MVIMEMHFVRVRGAKHLAPHARKATEPLTKRGGLVLTAQPVCDFQEVLSQHQDDSQMGCCWEGDQEEQKR